MRRMFSEKQIKSLVNEGIESGEINGGTKLYLHEISFGVLDSSNLSTQILVYGTSPLYLICSREQPFESVQEFGQLNQYEIIKLTSDDNCPFVSVNYDNGTITLITGLYDSDDQAIGVELEIDGETPFVDDVTPL